MKFGITKREKLALVAHIVSKPTANIEDGENRLTAWADLGVTDLASEFTAAAAGLGAGPQAAPWADHAKLHLVDLQTASVRYLLKKLEGEVPGVWSDVLRGLQRRLMRLEAGAYELPKELRDK